MDVEKDSQQREKKLKDRAYAEEMCYEYNRIKCSDKDKKKEIIKKLFRKTGEHFCIEPSFYCDYGYNIEIGEGFYSNHNLVILDWAKVKIGRDVMFGPNCGIYTVGHPLEASEREKHLAAPIIIGDNVWLGGNVIVLAGVTIGDNAVIGAGSVVTKDIPSNTLAVGNPCRVLKKI